MDAIEKGLKSPMKAKSKSPLRSQGSSRDLKDSPQTPPNNEIVKYMEVAELESRKRRASRSPSSLNILQPNQVPKVEMPDDDGDEDEDVHSSFEGLNLDSIE